VPDQVISMNTVQLKGFFTFYFGGSQMKTYVPLKSCPHELQSTFYPQIASEVSFYF